MYKRLITYNFANDETRDSFVEMIEDLDFMQQPDQSTYAQPRRKPQMLADLKTRITTWSSTVDLDAADCIQIYVMNRDELNRIDMKYSKLSKTLR